MDTISQWLTSPRTYPSKSNQWALSVVIEPATEPVTLTEVKSQLRIDSSTEDTYLNTLITAARIVAENRTQRSLITTTWDYFISEFPCGDEILLRRPKLQSVTSLKYKDTDGTETTWGTSNYIVDTASDPGRIVLAYGITWPSLALYPANPITIRYVAGYGAAAAVPQPIKQAMLYLVSHWFENREPVSEQMLEKVPMTFDLLINHYVSQRWRFA